jgi:hypothetical protein
MHTIALALIDIGVAGVTAFAALAFAARQLRGAVVPGVGPKLEHRLANPATRHATAFALLSAIALLAGLILYR